MSAIVPSPSPVTSTADTVLSAASAEGKDLALKLLPQIAQLAAQYIEGKLPAAPTPPPAGSDLERALHDSIAVRQKLDRLVQELREAGSILDAALKAGVQFAVTTGIGLLL